MPGLSTSAGDFRALLLRHDVAALDDHIGRGELDLGGAHRLDRQKHDVDLARFIASNALPAPSKQVSCARHAEPLGQLARERRRDAARIVGRAVRQHDVAEIDRGAQRAGRRQLLQNVGRMLIYPPAGATCASG